MSRLDVLRSLVRAAGDGARARVRGLPGVATLGERLERLRQGRVEIPARQLTSCLAHAEGVHDISVAATAGALRVHARLDGDREIELAILPVAARFAPGGAKELRFRVEPVELAHGAAARALVGSLAGLVTHTLYGPMCRGYEEGQAAFVERDGPGALRADVRSLPALRQAPRAASLALEAISLASFEVTEGALTLRAQLSGLAPR